MYESPRPVYYTVRNLASATAYLGYRSRRRLKNEGMELSHRYGSANSL